MYAFIFFTCRNEYEYEVGRFDGALPLRIEKHLDSFSELDATLKGKEDEDIMIVRRLP